MYQGLGYQLAALQQTVSAMGLYDSVCTVLMANNTADAVGQVDLSFTNAANYTALISDVPCMRAPASPTRVDAGENKGVVITEASNLFHVLLNGYYPQIPEAINNRAQLRALIDGRIHEVLGAESSSQLAAAMQTRIQVREIGV
jgi:hypothetical protein